MVALGQTSNPVDLVPGDPAALTETVTDLYNYGVLLTEAGQGLSKIDTADGWTGAAGDAFRQRFKGQPDAWLEAGSSFTSAAKALDAYIPVLQWAQGEAGVAIDQWARGDKKAANLTLIRAQGRLNSAADTASTAIGTARDKAPPHPGFWSDVGHFFSSIGHDLKTAGEDAVDALASLGNAAVQHPMAGLGVLGGIALTTVSTGGEVLGVGLDLTGVGAVVGVPVNVLSAAGMATGITMAAASGGDLIGNADGPDRVDPLKTSGGSPSEPSLPQPGTTGTGPGFGPDGEPVPAKGVNNLVRPPVSGDTAYEVYDPADPDHPLTEIDEFQGDTMVEYKSATGTEPGMDTTEWINDNVYTKLFKYDAAREFLPGYENAPIKLVFTEPGATPAFQAEVQDTVNYWKSLNPGVQVSVEFAK